MYRLSGMGDMASDRASAGHIVGDVTACDIPVVSWFNWDCWQRAGRAAGNLIYGQAPPVKVLATPPVPSGAYGEQALPAPGSGGGVTLPTTGTPDDVISAAVNQQMTDQQAIDASNVQGSWVWDLEGAAANAGDAAANAAKKAAESAMSPWLWLGLGLGAFALVAVAAGGPRRYGR